MRLVLGNFQLASAWSISAALCFVHASVYCQQTSDKGAAALEGKSRATTTFDCDSLTAKLPPLVVGGPSTVSGLQQETRMLQCEIDALNVYGKASGKWRITRDSAGTFRVVKSDETEMGIRSGLALPNNSSTKGRFVTVDELVERMSGMTADHSSGPQDIKILVAQPPIAAEKPVIGEPTSTGAIDQMVKVLKIIGIKLDSIEMRLVKLESDQKK